MTFLYDVVNLQFVLIIYFLVVSYLRLDELRSSLILGHIVIIFLLNGVLFPTTYMPDQLRYLQATQDFRGTFSLSDLSFTQSIPGAVFALIPLPFIKSVQSISMINFILYLSIFVFMKKKNISNNAVDYFYLLYPSLMLYSSVALRETLVLLVMIISIYMIVIRNQHIVGIILALPLILFKIQNFLIIVLVLFLYRLVSEKITLSKILFTLVFISLFIVLKDYRIAIWTVGEYFSLEKIEMYRNYMYYENTGSREIGYVPISGWISLPILAIKGIFSMLFEPLPWHVKNPLQLIQSVENIIIILLLLYLNTRKVYNKIIKQRIIFINLFLLTSMSLYGLMVFNYGAAARYRFGIFTIYIALYFCLIWYDKYFVLNYRKNEYMNGIAISNTNN